jgi:hypothetical protein
LSAFQSESIQDQAFIANEAVQFILAKYKEQKKITPKGVLIIGHSMGGIVARNMMTLSNYQPGSVLDIITLSTPHREPPIPLYRPLGQMYSDLNTFWRLEHRSNGKTANISLISIGGGTRDTILDSSLTDVSLFANPNASIHTYSSGTPRIWSSADHESAVWCDQILQSITFAAIDLYLAEDDSIESRMRILNRIFMDKSTNYDRKSFRATKLIGSTDTNMIQLDRLETDGEESRAHAIWLPAEEQRELFSLRMITNLNHSQLTAYACQSNQPLVDCSSLDPFMRTVPYPYPPNFPIEFKSHETPYSANRIEWPILHVPATSFTRNHVLVFEVQPNSKGFLFADVHGNGVNRRTYDTLTTQYMIRSWDTVMTRSVLTILHFPSFNDRFLKYAFQFIPKNETEMAFQPILMQKVGNEVKPLYSKQKNTISFYPSRSHPENQGLEIYVWMDPAVYGFEFHLTLNIFGTLGNVVTVFKTCLISFCIAVTILLYGILLSGIGTHRSCRYWKRSSCRAFQYQICCALISLWLRILYLQSQ